LREVLHVDVKKVASIYDERLIRGQIASCSRAYSKGFVGDCLNDGQIKMKSICLRVLHNSFDIRTIIYLFRTFELLAIDERINWTYICIRVSMISAEKRERAQRESNRRVYGVVPGH
jgi:hypothetical protein